MTSPSLDSVQDARENVVSWAQGCAEAADDGEGSALMSYHRDFLQLLAAFESALLTSLIRECKGMRMEHTHSCNEDYQEARDDSPWMTLTRGDCCICSAYVHNYAIDRVVALLRARLNGRTE